MNKLDAQRQKEIQQAEELLFAGPQALGFAKGLFQGHFVADWVMPYPRIPAAQQPELDGTLTELRQFLDEHLDPVEIDRKQNSGRDRPPLRIDIRFRECASLDWNSRVITLWNARAKTAMASKIVDWRTTGCICADRKGSRIGCSERANASASERGRFAFRSER